jgi:Protein of unknown function (DUF3800)
VARELYGVYVDETGDRGWGGRSSPIFVMSAAMVKDSNVDEMKGLRDDLCDKLGKPRSTELHWAENIKAHSARKFVSGTLAASPMVVTNVAVIKSSIMGSGTGLSDPHQQYNYAVRRLLERISWHVDEAGGEAIVTFAHVRRFPYKRLRVYLDLLQEIGSQIRWEAIRKTGYDQPHRIKLLQVADLTAGCCHSAFRRDAIGDYEPSYLMALAPRIYVRGSAPVSSDGMNIIGAEGCISRASSSTGRVPKI